jgi:hypothetical protein
MHMHGEHAGAAPATKPWPDPGAIQRAFEHRHEVVHLIYAAANEADAIQRLAILLGTEPATVDQILDQQLRALLPEHRAALTKPSDPAAQPADRSVAGAAGAPG